MCKSGQVGRYHGMSKGRWVGEYHHTFFSFKMDMFVNKIFYKVFRINFAKTVIITFLTSPKCRVSFLAKYFKAI